MGGHGGLNILPQKRWNVYRFDNIEKVRKDEEAAAKEEQIKREQSRKRDAEFRLQKLRRAKGIPDPSSPVTEEATTSASVEKNSKNHINLFEGLRVFPSLDLIKEDGRGEEKDSKRRKLKKEEQVAPPKVVSAEDDKYRLGYGIAGKGVKAPWYLSKPAADGGNDEVGGSSVQREEKKKSGKKTVEELREERLKREKREKERELALIREKSKLRGGSGFKIARMVNLTTSQLNEMISAAINVGIAASQTWVNLGVNVAGRAESWPRIYKQFLDGRPPAYYGTESLQGAMTWLEEIEKHLTLLECSESYKQKLTVFKLTGAAQSWWKTASAGLDLGQLTYEEFKVMFLEKFVPAAKQEQLRIEFLNLKQGKRTVEEYEREFSWLAVFAETEVHTEAKRIERFSFGLAPHIGTSIYGNLLFPTYNSVVNAAIKIERYKNVYWDEKAKGKAKAEAPIQNKFTPPARPTQGQGRGQGRGGQNNGNPGGNRKRPWNQGPGQGSRDIETVKCFNCGRMGHRAAFCPTPARNDQREPHHQGPPPRNQGPPNHPIVPPREAPARAYGAIQRNDQMDHQPIQGEQEE